MAGLPTPPHYHGHRERLRGRFREAGADALSDYELLELLLFRALRRRHHRTEGRAGGGEPASPRRHQKTASAVIVGESARLLPHPQGFADREQFRALFLDKRNLLIADEVQQTGTVDHTPVYPREVVKRALEAIIAVAGPLGIAVHDHLIVGKDGHASLKGLRLI